MQTPYKFSFLLFCFSAFLLSASYAQPVTLDPTFGDNGMTIISDVTEVKLVDFDKQGNIIAVGTTNNGNKDYLTIVKTNADGIIDQSFGDNGIVNGPEGSPIQRYGLKITKENKILITIIYITQYGESKMICARYNENGVADETFGDNGKLIINCPNLLGAISVNLKNDNFIIIGGYDDSLNPFIFKCNYNGEIDENFGVKGMAYLTDNETYKIRPIFIKILSDQSIFVAGRDEIKSDEYELVFCKLTPNGDLATNFANNGVWKMNIWDENDYGGEYEYFADVIEDGNGNLFFIGTVSSMYPFNAPKFVCSFHVNGTINNDFGVNGFYYYETNGHDGIPSAQKILQNGSKYIATFNHIRITSICSIGTLDTDFNNSGEFICDNFAFWDIKLQKDNQLILGGSSNGSFSIARLIIPSDVSVNQYSKQNTPINVFPNPVKNYLHFTEASKYEIIDFQGRVLQKNDKATQLVNVNHLKAGIYYIKFEDGRLRTFVKE